MEKQLPQIEKDVLVCAYGTLIRTWCLHEKYSKRFWETEEGYFDDFNAVSHWMPLPEPPHEHIDTKKAIEDIEKTINHKLGDKEIGIVNAFACIFEALAEKENEDGET